MTETMISCANDRTSKSTAIALSQAKMRAIVQSAYGDVDVFRVEEIDRPTYGEAEVLVRVHAAGLDRGTWHLMTGKPYLMRIMGLGFSRPNNRVPGLDVAGTVVAVGSAVTRFAVGDEVFGVSQGAFAEFACAREDKLAHKPARLRFEEAAVTGISGLTAIQSLRDAGQLQAGQHVLVLGASGGVGSFAVQIAKALGAEVTAVCSTAKLDMVRSLGADHVLDYTRDDFATGSTRYDLILSIGGKASVSRLRRALSPEGIVVFVGSEGEGDWIGGLGRMLRAALVSKFMRQSFKMFVSREHFSDLEVLATMANDGKLRPVVDGVHALADMPEAMRRLEAGNIRGKAAIRVVPLAV